MGRRMVGTGGGAALAIYRQFHRIADRQIALGHLDHMDVQPQLFLGVDHLAFEPCGFDAAGVAGLAAGQAVERRLVGQKTHGLARLCGLYVRSVLDNRQHGAFGFFGVVAKKFGLAEFLGIGEPGLIGGRLAGTGPGFAGVGLLFGHRRFEAAGIDRDAADFQRVLSQIEREAVSVVEFEGNFAGQTVAGTEACRRFVQQFQAAHQRFAEAGFFQLQGLADQRLGAGQFGIGRAHFGD